MKRTALSGTCLPLLVAVALLAATHASAANLDVPLLKDLRKPVEKKEVKEDEKPVVPGPVSPERRLDNPVGIFPAGAVWYFATLDAAAMMEHFKASPTGAFWSEPVLAKTMRNNRFGLEYLFADLPASVVTKERVATISAVVDLATALGEVSEKMATAGYIDDEGRFSFLFAFDVGLDREPAFDIMAHWETRFFIANPGAEIERGDREANYIDIWSQRGATERSPAEVAVGFIENMAIVTNDRSLAQRCLESSGSGAGLADSNWGRRLDASIPASGSADVVGFLRMDALLEGLRQTPIARQAVSNWADYIGYGGREGEAMYYGLQFTAEGSRETFLVPTQGLSASASLVELLSKRLKPAKKWSTPNVLPYQPNPTLFLAAQMEGRQLGGLLRQERRLFGSSDDGGYFSIPPAVRRMFTNEVIGVMTGEVGMAFYPGTDDEEGGEPSWLMILPCEGNPAKLLPRAEHLIDRAGVHVMSREIAIKDSPSWAVISPDIFRRAGGYHLVVASKGELLFSTIDQLIANSTFSNNRDFVRALEQAESDPGLLFYLNTPELLVRYYPELSQIMRRLYPRASGFNSRPPLTMLRRYAKGVLGAIAPSDNGSPFTRVTVQAPTPSLAATAASITLRYPANLRSEGRASMEVSRENLRTLWLRLQLYSSRFGHFPDTLDDLLGSMRADMPMDEIRALFTAPAALTRLTPAEALTGSYKYLSGITPNDEPDLPVIYENEPWSEDFAGVYPVAANAAPAETGEFQQFRQYVRLDGKVVVVSEKNFQEKILPRMRERE